MLIPFITNIIGLYLSKYNSKQLTDVHTLTALDYKMSTHFVACFKVTLKKSLD